MKEILKNDEIKSEYDALAPEYDIIEAMIIARNNLNLTQKDLSEKTGINQADISRIENGTRNPFSSCYTIASGASICLEVYM